MFGTCAGFSMVELMVALAVVAILASVGVPAYQDYVLRTHVAEAVAWTSGIRRQVEDNALNGVALNSGYVAPVVLPKRVASVRLYESSGTFQMWFKGGPIEGKSLIFVPKSALSTTTHANLEGTSSGSTIPAAAIIWTCRSDTVPGWVPGVARGTLPAKYAPAWCSGG